jgi:hypothetical protein
MSRIIHPAGVAKPCRLALTRSFPAFVNCGGRVNDLRNFTRFDPTCLIYVIPDEREGSMHLLQRNVFTSLQLE